MIRVDVEVRVRVRVSNLLGSDQGQCEFRVIIRVREELGLGLKQPTKLDNDRVGTRWPNKFRARAAAQ